MQSCLANGCKVWATLYQAPPADMKTNLNVACSVIGKTLIPDRIRSIRYLYFKLALPVWRLILQRSFSMQVSPQNEPDTCFSLELRRKRSQQCRQRTSILFIAATLGPTLVANGQSSTCRSSRIARRTGTYGDLTTYADTCMGDSSCSSYVGITAFHDYDNAPSTTKSGTAPASFGRQK